jgi:Fe-S oxidoreductase
MPPAPWNSKVGNVRALRSRLPLVDAHPDLERAHTYCAFCPKLCRFACPVSTVQGSETTTPWAKMSAVHHAASGNLPLEPSLAASFWACTGCQRCRSFCNHDNEVAAALNAARAEAVRAGVAPKAAMDVIARHEARVAGARAAARALFDAKERGADSMRTGGEAALGKGSASAKRAATVFVPGCTACVRTPEAARNGADATRLLAGEPFRVEAEGCCGLPLLEAGDLHGFVRAASTLLARLADAREAVFQDPGCLHAITVEARRHGVTGGPPLLHLSELGARHLHRLARVPEDWWAWPVRYHDPCRLGRGLGIYDAPRSVLGVALGRPPAEFGERRDRAECSGAGGQLPRTAPETARAIARERAEAHARAGGGMVVTACAASAVALRRSSVEVRDFATVLAHSLHAAAARGNQSASGSGMSSASRTS